MWVFTPSPTGSILHNYVTPGATTHFSRISDTEWTISFVVSLITVPCGLEIINSINVIYFLQEDSEHFIYVEDDQKENNAALFSKILDDDKVIDVYFIPIEGGTQSIVGKTKESVPNVFLWKKEEQPSPTNFPIDEEGTQSTFGKTKKMSQMYSSRRGRNTPYIIKKKKKKKKTFQRSHDSTLKEHYKIYNF